MASKAMLFLFSILVLVASRVSANEQFQEKDVYPKVPVPVPAHSPPVYKAPAPAPSVKPLPPTPAPPVQAPYTPAPPVKAPYAPPPPVKAPYTPAPPKAPYTPAPPVKPPTTPPPVSGQNCYPQCGRRCQLHSRKRLCIRACVTCCYRCKCVPPGTYGNREVCGKCYTDMTTHGNRIKCP